MPKVETKSLDGIAKIPIAVLKAGETRCITLNIEFPDSVTFRLVEGNGPVYILGQHIPMINKNEGELSDEEYISEEEGVSFNSLQFSVIVWTFDSFYLCNFSLAGTRGWTTEKREEKAEGQPQVKHGFIFNTNIKNYFFLFA